MNPQTLGAECASLGPDDAADVAAVWSLEGCDETQIRWELERPDQHVWLGSRDHQGQLVAAHRALVWHRHLLLKGLCVNPSAGHGAASLQLALAMRSAARAIGLDGVAAWVEPHRPEAQLAARLRLEPATTLLHRYLIPVMGTAAAQTVHDNLLSGVVDLSEPLTKTTKDVFASRVAESGDRGRVAWLLDRGRMLLSTALTGSHETLGPLLAAVTQATGLTPRAGYEVLIPAADVLGALGLVRSGARRLSRTPVRLALPRGSWAQTGLKPEASQ